MSMLDNLRKHDLDCLRLASDLTQLANDVLSPALRTHLLQMARACRLCLLTHLVRSGVFHAKPHLAANYGLLFFRCN